MIRIVESYALLLLYSTSSIREGKLSDLLNTKDAAAVGNKFRIFRTAPDSSYFDSELMTVTFLQIA